MAIDCPVKPGNDEISDFNSIKNNFSIIENTIISDIENSSTFFRVAGAYLRIMQGGVEGVDTKEFKNVMDSQDGYGNQPQVVYHPAADSHNYRGSRLGMA